MVFEPDPLLTSLALGRQREREAEEGDSGVPIDATLMERARQILIPIARSGQRVTYVQFAAQLGDPAINARNSGELLTMVSELEGGFQRPLLGVVVVSQHTKRPGSLFCDLIREMRGWDCDDEEAYLKELALVYEFWRPV